jgi:hypothetical protein
MRKSVMIGVGVVVAALAIPGASVAADKITDVFVTNDSSHPVPVVAQGTTNVAGTVNVGNSPTVNVASNSSDRQPYQKTIFFNQSPSTCTQFVCTVSFDAVPAGKRLVITYASAQWGLTSGGNFATASVGVNGNGLGQPQVLLPAAVLSGFSSWVAAGPLTFYAEAGDVPTMQLAGQFVQPVSNTAEAAIVGYLVPA